MPAKLRSFLAGSGGTASLEFVLLFPIFIFMLLASIEAAIFMVRTVMLDRGVDIAVRELRIGTEDPPSFQEFKSLICANTILIANCEDVVQVELRPVDMTTWAGLDGPALCRDVASTIDPFDQTEYTVGTNNQLMMVRVCALYDPFLPTTTFGLRLRPVDGEHYAIVITSAFVNEPAAI